MCYKESVLLRLCQCLRGRAGALCSTIINTIYRKMKKTIVATLMALCALTAPSYADTDAQWGEQVVARLNEAGVRSHILDSEEGLVSVVYDTRVGDVKILIDPETNDETMIFYCGLNTHVDKDQINNVLPVINSFNAKSRLTRACIDPDDGQLIITVWTNCETLPTAGALRAILHVIVNAAEELVPRVVDAR